VRFSWTEIHSSAARCIAALFCALILSACAGQDVAPSAPITQRSEASAQVDTSQMPTGPVEGPVLSEYQLIPGLAGSSPAVSATPMPPGADGLIRVGLLVPLTGPSAPIGQALLNAAQMAMFDVGDERFVLQVYDTQGVPEGAQAATAEAISEGVQLLLGPLFSAEVAATSPDAAAAGVNIIAFSTDPSVASPRVFVMGFLVDEQVRHVIQYAGTQGHLNYAVLAPNSAYGQAVVESMTRYVPRTGGKITNVAYYDPSGSDLNAVVRQLANFDQRKSDLEEQIAELEEGLIGPDGEEDEEVLAEIEQLELRETIGEVEFDAVLVPEQGVRLTQAATLLPFFDVDPSDVQLLGTMLWNAPGLGREPALLGGLYPAPPPESTQRFSARYRALHGQAPPSIATHGYDAVALAAVLAQSGGMGAFSAQAITNASGFAGIDGIFRFTPEGLSQRGFAIMEVTRNGAIAVQPAPSAFEAIQF